MSAGRAARKRIQRMSRGRDRLPATVPSLLGPVSVTPVAGLNKEKRALGITRFESRTILIEADAAPATLWQTLGHEIMHVVLWDGALAQRLSHRDAEAVCDAFGTWFAAAVQDGTLTIRPPRP